MKKSLITLMIVICTISAITLSAFKVQGQQVKGWILTGRYPQGYAIGIENSAERNGHVAFLKSTQSIKNGKFGTIAQSFIPEDYLGKRVRLTGYIKSADVKGWAGMWFRIDGADPRTTQLGFDNMQNRPIKGTTDWKKYDIVLDVPTNSKFIAFGVLLDGTGTVWLDDLHFEVVSNNTPETNIIPRTRNKPQNTNFEESEN